MVLSTAGRPPDIAHGGRAIYGTVFTGWLLSEPHGREPRSAPPSGSTSTSAVLGWWSSGPQYSVLRHNPTSKAKCRSEERRPSSVHVSPHERLGFNSPRWRPEDRRVLVFVYHLVALPPPYSSYLTPSSVSLSRPHSPLSVACSACSDHHLLG